MIFGNLDFENYDSFILFFLFADFICDLGMFCFMNWAVLLLVCFRLWFDLSILLQIKLENICLFVFNESSEILYHDISSI